MLAIRRQVHSRAGGVGRALGRLRLPVADLNAMVHALVAPPRFDCAEIAPEMELVESVGLTRVLIIGGDSTPLPVLRPERSLLG